MAARIGAVRGTWCPATAAAMAFLVQQGTVREAEATAQQLRVLPYSDSSFHRVSEAVGVLYQQNPEPVEERLIAAYEVPTRATGISVSLDRTAMPFEEPRRKRRRRPKKGAAKRPVNRVWHVAYCSTVSLHDADGKTLHTIRYSRMPDGDTASLLDVLFSDVRCLRQRQPDLPVIVLCDGAAKLWKLLGTEFIVVALEIRVNLTSGTRGGPSRGQRVAVLASREVVAHPGPQCSLRCARLRVGAATRSPDAALRRRVRSAGDGP